MRDRATPGETAIARSFCTTRSGTTTSLSAFPGQLAGLHAKGQDGRLARVLREAHGAELLGFDRGQERSLRRTRKAMDRSISSAKGGPSPWSRRNSSSRPAPMVRQTRSSCPARMCSAASCCIQAATATPRAYKGKNCVVIGAASSGHDVALDLWEAGANVTMVQRTPTTVVRSETLMEIGFDIYSEQAVAKGIDVETADMIAMATPFALQPPLQRALYEKIKARDAAFYDKLRATGFLLDFGRGRDRLDDEGLRTGSGYYIDVGCSQLIIDGEIKVKSGVDIERLTERGIRFVDGTEIDADVVIQATGFQIVA